MNIHNGGRLESYNNYIEIGIAHCGFTHTRTETYLIPGVYELNNKLFCFAV